MKLLHTLFLLVLCTFHIANAHPLVPEVPNHKLFYSPDRRYQAQLVQAAFPRAYDPPETCLSIKDQQTGVSTLAGVLPPVFAVKWTTDSKCIILLEHIAGGLLATAICCYADGKWQRHQIVPLSEDKTGSFEAIKIVLGAKTFEVTYKVIDTSVDNHHPDYYVCTLIVDSTTGVIISIAPQQSIDVRKYIKLSFKG